MRLLTISCLCLAVQIFLPTFGIRELGAAWATFDITTFATSNSISCNSIGLISLAGSSASSRREYYLVLNVSERHAFRVAVNLSVACAELVEDLVNSYLELLVVTSPW